MNPKCSLCGEPAWPFWAVWSIAWISILMAVFSAEVCK